MYHDFEEDAYRPNLEQLKEALADWEDVVSFRVQDNGHRVIVYADPDWKSHDFHIALYDYIRIHDYGFVIHRSNKVYGLGEDTKERREQVSLISLERLMCDW